MVITPLSSPGIGETCLATDVLIGESDDHAVLRRVVLVLVLYNQATTSVVVSTTLTSPAELDLETLKVRLVLHHFNETLDMR